MNKIIMSVIYLLFLNELKAQVLPSIHDFKALTITGDTIQMNKYAGKKLLIVNTASYCGYTYQFGILEKLYQQYKSYNFEIIGFPSNDFGGQDPYADSTIYQFCTSKYNVTFQMMEKVKIANAPATPIYDWLQKASLNGVKSNTVAWNFNKFLIDENGHWVAYYPSATLPTDTAITNWIIAPTLTGITSKKSEHVAQFIGSNIFSNQIELILQPTKSEVNITLFNIDGSQIESKKIVSAHTVENVTLNTSHLCEGVYFISVSEGDRIQTLKAVLLR